VAILPIFSALGWGGPGQWSEFEVSGGTSAHGDLCTSRGELHRAPRGLITLATREGFPRPAFCCNCHDASWPGHAQLLQAVC
jgi:hypothetical protein